MNPWLAWWMFCSVMLRDAWGYPTNEPKGQTE